MTDERIITSLMKLSPLPTINETIVLFHCTGYQQAKRCLEKAKEKRGGEKKILTLEDF